MSRHNLFRDAGESLLRIDELYIVFQFHPFLAAVEIPTWSQSGFCLLAFLPGSTSHFYDGLEAPPELLQSICRSLHMSQLPEKSKVHELQQH